MEQAHADMRKAIVISAVNLNRGGTLRILRDCLAYLSAFNETQQYRIIAIVYDQSLCSFPNITYIETKWPKKRWINRLWYEYMSLRKISQRLQPIALWLSLHDTSPTVLAEKRAVYCHNSFPFLKWNLRDLLFAPKIVQFALFSRFFYRVNIHQNDYVIVQQEWFRRAFVQLFNLKKDRIIVAPPSLDSFTARAALPVEKAPAHGFYTFLYPAIADSHKNFECICQAAKLLLQAGIHNFKVQLTMSGDENAYAKWLKKKWGDHVPAIEFLGYLDRDTLFRHYEAADSLIFASRVETWGLPISEFSAFKKPMLLVDLPYAHETAQGAAEVSFFPVDSPEHLANQMRKLIENDRSFLHAVERHAVAEPRTNSWATLFDVLLHN